MKYNNPDLKKSGNSWYRKNLQKNANISVNDSIMCWFQWPHYNLFVPEKETVTQWYGGETPWYISVSYTHLKKVTFFVRDIPGLFAL